MDEADFRILGHILRQPLAGPTELASRVGLTRNAVARRVRAMEESRLRLRWFAGPHPSLFGWRAHLSLFGPHERIDAREILAVPGVIGFDHNFDGLVPVTYYGPRREPAPRLVDLLGTPTATYDTSGPGPASPHLSRLQWKVLCGMMEKPRATPAALARATGLGAKTVAQHRRRLTQDNAIRIAAYIQEGAADFPIFRVYLQGRPSASTLEAIVPGAMKLETTTEPVGQVLFCRAATTSAVMAAVNRLQAAPGVEDVKVILTQRIEVAQDRLLAWCEERRDGRATRTPS